MNASLFRLLITLASWILATPSLVVGHSITQQPSMEPTQGIPAEPELVDQWLDEVRAQRQAWEERRRAKKEAIDARRRWIDPWGTAQQEARREENQRRREALRNKIEQDRDAFRSHSPWRSPQAPWQEPLPSPGSDGQNPISDVPDILSPYPPLPGWNNGWYFRGY